ncbi:class I SAM-dependent methyltransferase [Mesobacillus foraminis]|uniref:Uncharacterized methyltransferase EV146_104171 n=1 Tax=Mesobacillus foraminis TaxID=279826 RepID=A0A4R2BJB6_9BACI|nr:class I SAM-dependent methyltransferase [Mesobacillus foraminis]TCN26064.1 putative AdoMet-dependent methyltransferase [Mesobacillus foraminis]
MGREFLNVFDEWASSYDSTVGGNTIEYQEVFRGYQSILETVAERSFGHVLEFGAGTGNLTDLLLRNGNKVTGIEPSPAMRKIAEGKLKGKMNLLDGDFLNYPDSLSFDTIVSTYAFHHLTDFEKNKAIAQYKVILKAGGRIVFADTMFQTKDDYNQAIKDAKLAGFPNLAKDLETEYYTTIPVLRELFEKNDYKVTFSRRNRYVWILEAVSL